jgi:hypothetical protein
MSDNTPESSSDRNGLVDQAQGKADTHAEAVAFLERQLEADAPNLDAATRRKLASMGAAIAKRSAKAEAEAASPTPAPTPEPPTAARLVPWGQDYRAAPNAVFRSALFPALNGNGKENRRFLKEESVFCVAGLQVFFTGEQFDQSDLDVYLELLNLAAPLPLGTPVEFSAHALLKALGLHTGGKEHDRLHSVLVRLCGGIVDLTDHGKRYFGQLLHGGVRDELTLVYKVHINPKFAVLIGPNMWSKLDLKLRRDLGRNNTAKALHAYYSSHVNPGPHHVETLCNIAGLAGKNRKATLLKAHEALKSAGFCQDYTVADDTILLVNMSQHPSQHRALAAQATKGKPRRRKAMTHIGELLPSLKPPK